MSKVNGLDIYHRTKGRLSLVKWSLSIFNSLAKVIAGGLLVDPLFWSTLKCLNNKWADYCATPYRHLWGWHQSYLLIFHWNSWLERFTQTFKSCSGWTVMNFSDPLTVVGIKQKHKKITHWHSPFDWMLPITVFFHQVLSCCYWDSTRWVFSPNKPPNQKRLYLPHQIFLPMAWLEHFQQWGSFQVYSMRTGKQESFGPPFSLCDAVPAAPQLTQAQL